MVLTILSGLSAIVSAVVGWRYGSKAGVIAWTPTLVIGFAAFLEAAVTR
jgi:hypothetical protein